MKNKEIKIVLCSIENPLKLKFVNFIHKNWVQRNKPNVYYFLRFFTYNYHKLNVLFEEEIHTWKPLFLLNYNLCLEYKF